MPFCLCAAKRSWSSPSWHPDGAVSAQHDLAPKWFLFLVLSECSYLWTWNNAESKLGDVGCDLTPSTDSAREKLFWHLSQRVAVWVHASPAGLLHDKQRVLTAYWVLSPRWDSRYWSLCRFSVPVRHRKMQASFCLCKTGVQIHPVSILEIEAAED